MTGHDLGFALTLSGIALFGAGLLTHFFAVALGAVVLLGACLLYITLVSKEPQVNTEEMSS